MFDDNNKVKFFPENDPANFPWGDSGAEYIYKYTGFFTTIDKSALRIKGGTKKVIISAPYKDTPMFVMIVYNNTYYGSRNAVSNAPHTTNCQDPLEKVLHGNFIMEEELMTTIHADTATQLVVDSATKGENIGGEDGLPCPT